MVTSTKEKDLEMAIEQELTGMCREQVMNQANEPPAGYLAKHHGFQLGFSHDFDPLFALSRSPCQ